MESPIFTYYDERGIPKSSRQLTREQLAKVRVSTDNKHLINIREEYCEICGTDECDCIEMALEHCSEIF